MCPVNLGQPIRVFGVHTRSASGAQWGAYEKTRSALAIAIGAVAGAHAADLPTSKGSPLGSAGKLLFELVDLAGFYGRRLPAKSYAGLIVYATIDVGIGYQSNGAGFNPAYANGVANFVSKQSNGPKWLWTPNGINQSVAGIKMSEPIGYGWSLVGALETAFDPYSGEIVNGQKSLVQNNGKALVLQNANSDFEPIGQWDNSAGFIGVSNPTYGTLTAGRVTSLSFDGLVAGDPMGGAYAFSPFGYSGSYAGFGETETNRANTGVKYRASFMNFRAAGLVQWGGYDQGNGMAGMYQGQIGGDFANLFGGALSLDAIGSYAKDTVNVSTFTGSCAVLKSGPLIGQTGCMSAIPTFYDDEDLKATLSNNTGLMLLSRYIWGPVTLSGGYEWWRQADPSGNLPQRLRNHRRIQRPRNNSFDRQERREIVSDPMDRL